MIAQFRHRYPYAGNSPPKRERPWKHPRLHLRVLPVRKGGLKIPLYQAKRASKKTKKMAKMKMAPKPFFRVRRPRRARRSTTTSSMT